MRKMIDISSSSHRLHLAMIITLSVSLTLLLHLLGLIGTCGNELPLKLLERLSIVP